MENLNKFKEKYVDRRKKLLIENDKLILKRIEINQELRKINKELKSWDRILINNV